MTTRSVLSNGRIGLAGLLALALLIPAFPTVAAGHQPAPTDVIKIRSDAGQGGVEGGFEVGDLSLTTGQTQKLCAALYDKDGAYLHEHPVNWVLAGASKEAPSQDIGTFSDVQGACTIFTANRAGSGVIHANDAAGHLDSTGLITVVPDATLAALKVRDVAGQDVQPFATNTDPANTVTFVAAGFDAQGNFIGNQDGVTWSLSDASKATLSPVGGGATATFDPQHPGAVTITIAKEDLSATAGPIFIVPGTFAKLTVRDGPAGTGAEVGAFQLTADDKKTLYAASYDADDNFLGDRPDAAWSVLNAPCGTLSPEQGPRVDFDATRKSAPGENCLVQATAMGHPDATGAITVTPGARAAIGIHDAPAGTGNPVGDIVLDTATNKDLFAVGTDADGNFVENVEGARWAIEDPCGALSANVGARVQFDPTTVTGPGQACRVTANITGETVPLTQTAGTGNITVVASGTVAAVKVRSAELNGGVELGAWSLTTDDELSLFAAAYDQDFNYIGEWGAAAWALAPAGTDVATITSPGGTATLDGKKPGTVTATATVVVGSQTLTDSTGLLTVSVGALAALTIRDTTDGLGQAVGAFSITSGTTKTVFAAGYDAEGNFIADHEATWSVVNDCGSVDPEAGASTTFTAGFAAMEDCVVHAQAGAAADDTGLVTIVTPAVSVIKVRTASNNGGDEVTELSLTADQSAVFWAAGYDASENYLGDQTVTWSVTGGIGDVVGANPATSITFEANTADTGTVDATLGSVVGHTGTITVTPGALAALTIRDTTDGLGLPVGAFSINSGATKTLVAAGYDADENFVADQEATWSVVNECGTLDPEEANATTFTAGFFAIDVCLVHAEVGALSDDTGAITIVTPNVAVIKVRTAADNLGDEVADLSLTADNSATFWAAGYDASENYLGDQAVTWSVTGGIGALMGANPATSITFEANTAGTGAVHATLGSVVGQTGTITVTPGAFNKLTLGGAPSSAVAGTPFTLTVTAKDADDNVKTTFAGTVSFTSTDASAVLPAAYTFVAGDAGVHAFAGVAYRTVGVQSVTVASGAVSRSTAPATISPAAASKLVLSCLAGPCAVQAAVGFGVSVEAQDPFGNRATGYTGGHPLVLSGAANAPDGTVPQCADANLGASVSWVFTAGVASASCTFYKAETASLAATDGTLTTPTSLAVPVVAAAPDKIIALFQGQTFDPLTDKTSGAVAPLLAGAPTTLTLRVLDPYRNVATSYAGAQDLTLDGAQAAPDGTPPTASDVAFGTATTVNFVNGVGTTTLKLYAKAPRVFLNVTDGTFENATTAFSVQPGVAVVLGILSCSPSADDRSCVLRSETVTDNFQPDVGTTVNYFAGLFDSWDNLLNVVVNIQGVSMGTTRTTPCTTPVGTAGTLTLTCTYEQAGTDIVAITTLPTIPTLPPVTLLQVDVA